MTVATQSSAPLPIRPDMVIDGCSVAPVHPIAVSVRTAASMLSLSERTMAKIISDGEIQTAKVGNRRLVPVHGLSDWLDRRINGGVDQ
ncbi:hypothetical protein K227x_27490 [Rubripirellula lacrimiformis]|uniref:Helix-turn-helix domain-containing protein n=1 Tax=Rubripirellula lacrimiformis TaxID=1930273 RepID=A0A517NBG3_9BACT|nr:helix-turn-helix domain-containing protein [Rubripirellula lacrimiformis]QDT04358.1 hypothetical protein K227x_27490 [Rubripirellula lacrimiformis]